MIAIPITARNRPQLDEKVFIYRKGRDHEGKERGEWYHAFYRIHPSDKRRRIFADWPSYITESPWIYSDVTHWMKMPDAPER